MEHITIQPDTDLSNPWTSSYIRIGNAWEAFAKKNNLQISGLLSPYGIKCNISGSFNNFRSLEIEFQKQLENVSAGIPRRSPYSSIINLECTVRTSKTDDRITIKRKGLFTWMMAIFKGLTTIARSKKLVAFTAQRNSGLSMSNADLEILSELHWLRMKARKLELRMLHIPDNIEDIELWFNALERILTEDRH